MIKKVLCIDDDQITLILCDLIIKKAAFAKEVLMAGNGKEGLAWFSNYFKNSKTGANEEAPNLIFLDLNMPLKNGLECLQEIKRNLKFEFLPIVIFSTSYDKKISEMLYKNGAQYYICKPSSFTCLKNVIEFVLSLIASDINNKVKTTQPEKEKFYIELK